MSGSDWTEVVGAVGLFALVIATLCTVIVQVAATARAKAVLARESEYRDLARASTDAQSAVERQLETLLAQSSTVRDRLDAIENILKAVE